LRGLSGLDNLRAFIMLSSAEIILK
jgi:hypothetical protein